MAHCLLFDNPGDAGVAKEIIEKSYMVTQETNEDFITIYGASDKTVRAYMTIFSEQFKYRIEAQVNPTSDENAEWLEFSA